MKTKRKLRVSKKTFAPGVKAQVIEQQYISSLKKYYYTVQMECGYVYLTTHKGLESTFKDIKLNNDIYTPQATKPSKEEEIKNVLPNSGKEYVQINLF